MFWCNCDLYSDSRRKRNARRGWQAFVPHIAEGKRSQNKRGAEGFYSEAALINGLIKKPNQLRETCTVCHAGPDYIAFVEPHQADVYGGRTDYFHGKASGNITVKLQGWRFVAFSSASRRGIMFLLDTSGLFSLCA